MSDMKRTNDRLDRAVPQSEPQSETPKPEFGTPEYVEMWFDRGQARGYVYGRYDAGDHRVDIAATHEFADRFIAAAGHDAGALKALYEQFAAEQATPSSDPKGGQR